jgi:hypothetical protein
MVATGGCVNRCSLRRGPAAVATALCASSSEVRTGGASQSEAATEKQNAPDQHRSANRGR